MVVRVRECTGMLPRRTLAAEEVEVNISPTPRRQKTWLEMAKTWSPRRVGSVLGFWICTLSTPNLFRRWGFSLPTELDLEDEAFLFKTCLQC